MAAYYEPARVLPVRSKWLRDQVTSEYPPEWVEERWQSNDPDLDIKALVIRDSTSIAMRSTIAEHFRDTVFLTTHRYDNQSVLRERPDVVIEIIVERGVAGLEDGYFHLQEAPD